MAKENRSQARQRRHVRIRRKVSGTTERPRLNVYRSLNHIYAQVIDDVKGHTIAAASTVDKSLRADMQSLNPQEQAKSVGQAIADRAKEQGVTEVVFDRGGYPYHGRIKALAEGSREGGLVF